MLLLSNKLSAMISVVKPDNTVDLRKGKICTFSGKMCDELRAVCFLNMVFFDRKGGAFGLLVDEFEKKAG